jgi:hypothetical protein
MGEIELWGTQVQATLDLARAVMPQQEASTSAGVSLYASHLADPRQTRIKPLAARRNKYAHQLAARPANEWVLKTCSLISFRNPFVRGITCLCLRCSCYFFSME